MSDPAVYAIGRPDHGVHPVHDRNALTVLTNINNCAYASVTEVYRLNAKEIWRKKNQAVISHGASPLEASKGHFGPPGKAPPDDATAHVRDSEEQLELERAPWFPRPLQSIVYLFGGLLFKAWSNNTPRISTDNRRAHDRRVIREMK
jgi:hypothetical protein